jgi:hypothetical protein
MPILSTKFDGTTTSVPQATVTFDTEVKSTDVFVTVKLYAGPSSSKPIGEQKFDLSPTSPTETVAMNKSKPTLNGTLKLDGNIVTFEGRMISGSVVNVGLLPGIIAIL